jgi:hypothetical protein
MESIEQLQENYNIANDLLKALVYCPQGVYCSDPNCPYVN